MAQEGWRTCFITVLVVYKMNVVLGDPEQPLGRVKSRGHSGCNSRTWTSQRESPNCASLLDS